MASKSSKKNEKQRTTKKKTNLQILTKRMSRLNKDYNKLFSSIVSKKLNFDLPSIGDYLPEETIEELVSLLTSSEINVDNYINLILDESERGIICSNFQLFKMILDINKQLNLIINNYKENTVSSIEEVKTVLIFVDAIESIEKISLDVHIEALFCWWFPQLLEILSLIQLQFNIINSSSSSSSNNNKNDNISQDFTFENYTADETTDLVFGRLIDDFNMNTISLLFFLSGKYFVDDAFYINCIQKMDKKEQKSDAIVTDIQEKSRKLTVIIRKRLSYAIKEKPKESIFNSDNYSNNYTSAQQRSTIKSFKDIYENIPQQEAHIIYSLVSFIPEDIKTLLGFSNLYSRSVIVQRLPRNTSAIISYRPTFTPGINTLVQYMNQLSNILTNIQDNWPIYDNTPLTTESITRHILIIERQTNIIHSLDQTPFCVPEIWESWVIFIKIMHQFCKYLFLNKTSLRKEVFSQIEQIKVQIRFFMKFSNIQTNEFSIFD
eukprot:TRINITY_DN4780_c6_g1_i1.p1 TRINITY_DN4780_c6_g1~~TRINITY_DN4780_c6_g1_i1.p1  ORF type:complete len:492 (+),score=90.31 TRINITY_DN4780_c6_g1_i1:116-1591(+)